MFLKNLKKNQKSLFLLSYQVKSGQSKIDKTKVLKTNTGLKDRLSLNAGLQNGGAFCNTITNFRLMQVNCIAECSPLEHSAILLTCIKQQSVLKNNFWSSLEWPLKTGFTVCLKIWNYALILKTFTHAIFKLKYFSQFQKENYLNRVWQLLNGDSTYMP